MRLYNKAGDCPQIDDELGSFTPGSDGAFELPDPVAAKLHNRPGWETEAQRAGRLATEELEKFRDPATLLAAVREMSSNQGLLAQALAGALGLTGVPAATPAQASTPGAPGQATAGYAAPAALAPEASPTAKAAVPATEQIAESFTAGTETDAEAEEETADAAGSTAPAESAVKAATKKTAAKKTAAGKPATAAN